jgi:hypothetical protein
MLWQSSVKAGNVGIVAVQNQQVSVRMLQFTAQFVGN